MCVYVLMPIMMYYSAVTTVYWYVHDEAPLKVSHNDQQKDGVNSNAQ